MATQIDPRQRQSNQINSAQLNSVQLNVVTVVDVDRALAKGTLDGNLYMMDNGVDKREQGTARLSTTCRPGQVINWIIYPMDSLISARINNITFIERKVCARLQIYGASTSPTSPWPCLTPTYDYWAGLVLPDLPSGVYRYRLELQLKASTGVQVMSIDTPSFHVLPLSQAQGQGAPRRRRQQRAEDTDQEEVEKGHA